MTSDPSPTPTPTSVETFTDDPAPGTDVARPSEDHRGTAERLAPRIALEIAQPVGHVRAAVELLLAGNTIPFVARYRKEAHGSLDEGVLEQIDQRRVYLAELDSRRAVVLESIESQGKLTDDLREAIAAATSKQELEDLYLPYKPRRRTRAQKAREAGLEPLAEAILNGEVEDALPEWLARFVDADKGVATPEHAAKGAKDIIAETLAEDPYVRQETRRALATRGEMSITTARGAAEADPEGKFRDLDGYTQPVTKLPGHRVLAANRGEREKAVRVRVEVDLTTPANHARGRVLTGHGTAAGTLVDDAIEDGFARLLVPTVEAEVRVDLTEQAEAEAIEVFAENLRHLLLEAPLGPYAILGVDPAFRTGCKVAAIAANGAYLEETVIYPTAPKNDTEGAARVVTALVKKHGIHHVALGNGTASRETEAFLRTLAKQLAAGPASTRHALEVIVVSESGASVYSASQVARDEFPHLDLTVRSAISIARRLQDPLAELVKVDPKSIGVGQYQHDVDPRKLKAGLDRTVESCVNGVGVDLATASHKLLEYVSGVGARLAKQIVAYREREGGIRTRKELLKVPGLGPKAYEQAAGFLRIRAAPEGAATGKNPGKANPLDNTAVHPERYAVVKSMAASLDADVADLVGEERLVSRIRATAFVDTDAGIGLPTVNDILDELRRPGRDPRGTFEAFAFADVHSLDDLETDMTLPGIVTNVTTFGAFVDLGVHQDGLIHISQLADVYVANPSDVVTVGQKVRVRIMEVDKPRKRIGLSMKGIPQG